MSTPSPPPPPSPFHPYAPYRLWSSANKVANKASLYSQERPASHHGVRCSRCKVGPIVGSCYRCAAGCVAKRFNAERVNAKCLSEKCLNAKHLHTKCLAEKCLNAKGLNSKHFDETCLNAKCLNAKCLKATRFSKATGPSEGSRSSTGLGGGREARDSDPENATNGSGGEGCYTLCEACFSERGQFHPPHPFARLRPGFGDSRLSGPELYEAV